MARLPRHKNSKAVRIALTGAVPTDTPGETITLAATTAFHPNYAGKEIGTYTIWMDVGAGLTGTFTVQGTSVPDPELVGNADWTTLTPTVIGGPLAVAGAAATTIATQTDVLLTWIRLVYTHTSGSGTFRGFIDVA